MHRGFVTPISPIKGAASDSVRCTKEENTVGLLPTHMCPRVGYLTDECVKQLGVEADNLLKPNLAPSPPMNAKPKHPSIAYRTGLPYPKNMPPAQPNLPKEK